jgi:hypothetical protein
MRTRKHRRINIAYLPCMLDITQHVNLTHIGIVLDGSQNELSDTSGPLFSLYSKVVGEVDKIRAKSNEKNAEGIVVFVSPRSCLHTFKRVN